jgi:large subunit ribosomal protein L10
MAITKAKKAEIYEGMKEVVKAPSITFVNFKGLTVGDTTKMRKGLRDNGVKYVVAKKTIAKKALNEAGIAGELPQLDGEIAFAYAEDLVAPAREVFKFQKEFTDKVSIVGGVFEGKFMNKSEMTEIATIPGLQTLHGMFVNLINSPIQGLAIALDAIAKKKETQ